MWDALATVRDLGRLQEIASVLVRYGFGDVVQRIGMAGALLGGLGLRLIITMAGWMAGFVGAILGAVALVWLWQRFGR